GRSASHQQRRLRHGQDARTLSMDWQFLRTRLPEYDLELFTLGKTVITMSSLLKLVVMAAVLYFVAFRLSRWTMARLLDRTELDRGTRAAVSALVHYTILIVGTVVVLQNAGIDLTAFAVVASAVGVGVGFGLQNIISNFISGLIIMFERPIQVGDRIELAGVEGVVQQIGARRSTIVTPDRIAILVPNQRFITDNVTNYVYLERDIRVRVPVGVAPDSDVRLVERLLLEAAVDHPGVQREPAPSVALTSLGGTAIGFELLVWYDGRRYSQKEVLSGLYFTIADRLKSNGIKTA
ncbi:MAG TPA: mechanosensitive ion channel domain-containing protein, partial [Burkholderiaceae bacterium]|nr:mechanosensitive ion channel domain-containing protein [Burkholderiaceae bacterium]